jgi:plasmid stabilization system protein ParE
MAHVRVSSLAIRDVRDILSDLHRRAGAGVAGQYAARFGRLYRSLAEFPASGAPRPSLGEHARLKVIRPYVVIYDHAEKVVTVLRVLHGHRDINIDLLGRPRGMAPPRPG